jgi:hypothetical protein
MEGLPVTDHFVKRVTEMA